MKDKKQKVSSYDKELVSQKIDLIHKLDSIFAGKKDNKGKLILTESILDFIYNSKHHSQIHELLSYMEYADDSDSKEVLDALMNAWNLFPHKSLGGISPKEMSDGYVSTKSIRAQSISKIHSENELYFEAMSAMEKGNHKRGYECIKKAVVVDPGSMRSRELFTSISRAIGDVPAYMSSTHIGYDLVKKKYKEWPKELEWGYIENRPYLKSILHMADILILDGHGKEGSSLYKDILRMCPNDNMGVRYMLAGYYAGLDPLEVEDMWRDANKNQTWSRMEKMVEEQEKIHKFLPEKTKKVLGF